MKRRCATLLGCVLAGCQPERDDLVDGALVLPHQLREVSGITAVDEHTIVCIQDEAGVVFFVDLNGVAPPRVVPFGPAADYEGIAFTGTALWVLRSDGILLRLAARGNDLVIAASYRLPDGCEYEGLCFDGRSGCLLVLPKGAASAAKRERGRRVVLAFDVARERLLDKPVVTLDIDLLIEQAEKGGFALPVRTTAKGKERISLKLHGSELTCVAGTDDLLLLSAAEHLLMRVGRDGRLLATRLLPEELLPQPEAMTVLADGRLLIASEGKQGPAVVRVAAPL